MEEGDLDFIDKGELKSPWSTELSQIKEVHEYKPVKGPDLAIQFVLKVSLSDPCLCFFFYWSLFRATRRRQHCHCSNPNPNQPQSMKQRRSRHLPRHLGRYVYTSFDFKLPEFVKVSVCLSVAIY